MILYLYQSIMGTEDNNAWIKAEDCGITISNSDLEQDH
jgi:hypothetical protein